ncbi:hypothetical protein B0T19DRAFT_258285 [Cercophora scortea]|uniref:Uncharacterized protein n=1 Tax=Cercophora scortea TaxID=314031 RepID=A0AAE0I9J2_9PEZI|nr:hypothetical protein B0T19DRAFT_258285 [Cercophora scortea]
MSMPACPRRIVQKLQQRRLSKMAMLISLACAVNATRARSRRRRRATDDMHACYPRSVPVPLTATLGCPTISCLSNSVSGRARRREAVVLTGFLNRRLGRVSITSRGVHGVSMRRFGSTPSTPYSIIEHREGLIELLPQPTVSVEQIRNDSSASAVPHDVGKGHSYLAVARQGRCILTPHLK